MVSTVKERVAFVTLDRPELRNAISRQMRSELLEEFSRFGADANIRVVVVSGRPPAFCSGADLGEADLIPAKKLLMDEYLPIFQQIIAMDKPVIAAVSGAAAGIGMSLALACDLMIMTEDAYLWAPFTKLGLVPDGGLSWLLTQHLGYRRAYAIAMQGERIPAPRALELGLTHRVVAYKDLLSNAADWARELAAGSQLAQSHVKKLVRWSVGSSFEDVFAAEAVAQNECEESEFFIQARTTFLGGQSR
nr:probable enoyl-CoA hydratase [Nerophis lumbriciformis]